MKNIAIRDGRYVASANLTGSDGKHYTIAGGSNICGPAGDDDAEPFAKFYAGSVENQEPSIASSVLDLSLATSLDIRGNANFKPSLYSS